MDENERISRLEAIYNLAAEERMKIREDGELARKQLKKLPMFGTPKETLLQLRSTFEKAQLLVNAEVHFKGSSPTSSYNAELYTIARALGEVKIKQPAYPRRGWRWRKI